VATSECERKSSRGGERDEQGRKKGDGSLEEGKKGGGWLQRGVEVLFIGWGEQLRVEKGVIGERRNCHHWWQQRNVHRTILSGGGKRRGASGERKERGREPTAREKKRDVGFGFLSQGVERTIGFVRASSVREKKWGESRGEKIK
jgi:hypothetical protein